MRILHLIDSLQRGGAEQAAVHLSNGLHQRGHQVWLCATRSGGPLATAAMCPVFELGKQRRFDFAAHRRLASFIAEHDVEVVHAHSTSLFTARQSLLRRPAERTKLVWHDHYGDLASKPRRSWPYRLVGGRLHAVVAASRELAAWSQRQLRIEATWLPNAVPAPALTEPVALPGTTGKRIVCVANFRPQKDHQTLVAAFAEVAGHDTEATLFLVGTGGEESTRPAITRHIDSLDLCNRAHLLGERDDVSAVLAACDVGVLSSRSEGLPLALVEYGWANLAVASTAVGQCADLLAEGRGLLVPAGAASELAAALLRLVRDSSLQRQLACSFHEFVARHYDLEETLDRLLEIYR